MAETFASQKFAALERVALDASLPKLASRIMIIFATRYMRDKSGRRAFPSIATLAGDLGIKSDSTIRDALGALVRQGHLVSGRRPGETTVYRLPDLAEKFAGESAGFFAEGAADTPPKNAADTPPNFPADTPPKISATNTGKDSREVKTALPAPEAERNGWERFSGTWTFGLGENEQAARSAFLRLSHSEREAAIQGAAAFQGAMAGRLHPPHAATYLRERKWKLHRRPSGEAPRSAAAPKAALPDDRGVFLRPGSEQLQAWHTFERSTLGRARPGCKRPTEWPPAQAAGRQAEEGELQSQLAEARGG